MPVQRATIRAISSSVTLSRSRLIAAPFLSLRFLLLRSQLRSGGRQLAILQLGSLIQVVFTLQPSQSRCSVLSISSRSFCTWPIGILLVLPLGLHGVELCRASRPVPSESPPDAPDVESVGLLFQRGFFDLMLHDLTRQISSSSVGMESISVRIIAQASSTRSMALSGRKRSEI